MRTHGPIFVKLGMWVVVDTSTHFVSRHRMSIFNTLFACLFWLANNKKGRYPEFFMGYCDESWYIGSGGHKYYLCGLSSRNADSQRPEEQFSTVLVSDCQKDIFQQCWFPTLGRTSLQWQCQISQTSRTFLDIPIKAAHAIYSVNIVSA